MRIGFCGTMSVGKTTLVKELSKLPEFKDYYIATERSKYLNQELKIPLNTDSSLNGQIIFLAERSAELLHENLITDRTVIDVIAFTSLASSISSKDKENFERLAKSLIKQYDYIFYLSPEEIPLEDNGIRCIDPNYREKINNEIQYVLNFYQVKYYKLTKNRINEIREIIFSNIYK